MVEHDAMVVARLAIAAATGADVHLLLPEVEDEPVARLVGLLEDPDVQRRMHVVVQTGIRRAADEAGVELDDLVWTGTVQAARTEWLAAQLVPVVAAHAARVLVEAAGGAPLPADVAAVARRPVPRVGRPDAEVAGVGGRDHAPPRRWWGRRRHG